jgi:hypothetical protein
MSKPDTVTQCRLRVRDASEMVSFIDSDAAVLGKRITIDDFPGIIWEVVFVGHHQPGGPAEAGELSSDPSQGHRHLTAMLMAALPPRC